MAESTDRDDRHRATLAKWIVCRTTPETRTGFARAQRAWTEIATTPGFLGQLGGFDGDDAHIVGLWRDASAHATFMRTTHDAVVERNRQSELYTSIRVELLEHRLDMPGRVPDLARALDDARLLRLADCSVRDGCVDRFLTAQREVWRPGMAEAPGMLAGAFWSCPATRPARFVVGTLWDGERSHDAYVAERLPSLRARARPEDDLLSIDGYAIPLLGEWTVRPG